MPFFWETSTRPTARAGSNIAVPASSWDAGSGRLLASLVHEGWVESVAWHPDGVYLAAAVAQGGIDLWHVPIDGEARRLVSLYETPDGDFAVTPEGDVDGGAAALEWVRFVSGWAVYDLSDLPERVSSERVRARLLPLSRAGRGVRG